MSQFNVMKGEYESNLFDYLKIDKSTNSIINIPQEHHEIHEGDHYFVKDYIDITGAGTITYFAFTTPDTTKWVHAKALFFGEGEFDIEIYEDATIVGGIAVTEQNCNRNSGNTPGLVAVSAPAVTGAGNLLWRGKTGSGRNTTGVLPGLNYEILAKQNSTYVFKITKIATGTHYLDFDFFWYEHTDKH